MDWSQALWTALALLLMLEGLLPFFSPASWRRAMMQIAQLRDGQIRFFGLIAIAAGLVILLLL
ncbi:DUF2065 domain-containing protein [Diaphorobacter ruginosibacter]|uniref:DUF2065 domain-containing protein n=1 Tax=Diaphorobacter ruginosibacter TaxID=1715720 RepID=A0A7G9RKR1_9BURK|nr:DUF2065 domain-containing protein [Diaphorobacter ruginosibacter]QNN56186.1 DUF2065 domain-containing protein [Diaphorobacter ruginosibacter]